MKIVIKYCRICNYLPVAARLGLDIRNEFGLDVEYKAAGSGVFDLFCDDVLVYSKLGAGDKFPGKGEAVSLLKKEIEKRK
ncbi:MAG TPA: SelT/SelW/SelH family protein [Nitrospirae bacterium]|nr:SelT/SelW/SelH family protein [Nitrospirota bacterium]